MMWLRQEDSGKKHEALKSWRMSGPSKRRGAHGFNLSDKSCSSDNSFKFLIVSQILAENLRAGRLGQYLDGPLKFMISFA
jgi:hypothetical protein